MSTTRGRIAAIMTAIAALTGTAVLAILLGLSMQNVSHLQAQVSGLQHSQKQGPSAAQIRGMIGKASGSHRDLITCGDLQQLGLPVNGTDSYGGQISAYAGPATLPGHCINR
jgi:hypothetical protein